MLDNAAWPATPPKDHHEFENWIKVNASKFTAYQRRGVWEKSKFEFSTLEKAQGAGRALAKLYRKPALIYAVTPAGRSCHIETIRPPQVP